jgi:hypothetical protein
MVSSGSGITIISPHLNNLHAILERPWDGVEGVCRADEQDLGEVDWHIKVVVEEFPVLCRIKQLEHRACRVTLVTSPQLVNLVQDDDGIVATHTLEGLDGLSGHGAHISPPVPLDLGHVRHAPHAEAVKLPVERSGNTLADARLAHPGRPYETYDAALHGALELSHCDELENSVLDILHPVVVLADAQGKVIRQHL